MGAWAAHLPAPSDHTRTQGAAVTVRVERSKPTGRSALAMGVTLTQYTLDPWGEPAAIARGKALLAAATHFQNQSIYGWGTTNPEPSPGVYDWSSLDRRMALIRSLGATPVITLCCAPDWMTRLGRNTSTYPNIPPTPAHYRDFATLARQIAHRYPDVHYFQVWNEMKGFYVDPFGRYPAQGYRRSPNAPTVDNNVDYIAYTHLYNAVYDALKAVNLQIQVGGPYLVIDSTGDPLTPQNRAVLTYWLAHKHGADFLSIDHSLVPYTAASVPSPAAILGRTNQFERIAHQVRQLTSLPLWWAESYFDSNFNRLGHATYRFQAAVLASITYHELRGGATATLQLGPQGNAHWPYHGDQQSLFSDTRQAGGGRPFPYYAAFKSFHTDFAPGTQLYQTTASSPEVEALASATRVMLINKRPTSLTVNLDGTPFTLAPYQVHTFRLRR
jgi:hypothetical protein